jgi:hypothetical protein
VDVKSIDQKTFDLSVKNPNGGEVMTHRSPQEIMDEIAALDAESAEVLGNIKALLMKAGWQNKLGDVTTKIGSGATPGHSAAKEVHTGIRGYSLSGALNV